MFLGDFSEIFGGFSVRFGGFLIFFSGVFDGCSGMPMLVWWSKWGCEFL